MLRKYQVQFRGKITEKGLGYLAGILPDINPYSLLANRILFSKTEFIGFAGYPIQSFRAAIVFAIAVGGGFHNGNDVAF
ncbi:hypothetical protein IMSAG049_01185 [Clostridiales bacterium]|nr:hypothetical protein IMSAG049_01185 [Clostridiales bacterium]